MGQYVNDGGVISNKIKTRAKTSDPETKLFGLYRATIVRLMDPANETVIDETRAEYVVKVNGFEYYNAANLREGGGIYNYKERIRKGQERSFTGELKKGTYDENADGEMVYVLFLQGYANSPIIVGAAEHPRRGEYKPVKPKDGLYDVEEFNGVEFLVDKDSNYTIKQVGRKDLEGVIENPEAVDSVIKMHGNGDIEFDTHGTGGTSDLRMKFTKADKKAEIYAQENKVIMDSVGIIVEDKQNNKIEMKPAGIDEIVKGIKNVNTDGNKAETIGGNWTINISGSATVTTGGTTTVNSGGDASVNAPTIKLNGSAGDVLTTTTDPVIDLITGAPTTGVPTVVAG
jgi:hypothetical protein